MEKIITNGKKSILLEILSFIGFFSKFKRNFNSYDSSEEQKKLLSFDKTVKKKLTIYETY